MRTHLGAAAERVTAVAEGVLTKRVDAILIPLTGMRTRPEQLRQADLGRVHLHRLPVVEVTDQLDRKGVRCIDAENNALLSLAYGGVRAEIFIRIEAGSVQKIRQDRVHIISHFFSCCPLTFSQ